MPEHGADPQEQIVEAAEEEERRSGVGLMGKVGGFMRSSAILIASVGALLTSIVAVAKPQSHTVTETSHDELSKTIQALATQQQQTHDDLVALRTYIADRNGEVFVLPSQASSPAASSSAAVILKPLVRPSPSASVATPLVPASSLPPPELHQFTKVAPPVPFAAVLTKANKI
jgi:hypothetical protein